LAFVIRFRAIKNAARQLDDTALNLAVGREFTRQMAQVYRRAFTIPMIKRHIVSRRLLLKSKWGNNLFLRIVRAFMIIRGALFSDKSPFLNHLLAPSSTLLSCSVVLAI
jgi:hypothetical protein